MATVIHPYLAQSWLQSLVDTPCYAGAFFEVPSTATPGARECLTASYARAILTWDFTTSTSRTIWNIQKLQWLNLQDTVIAGIGAWDSPVGGHLLAFWQLPTSVTITGRGSYQLDANTVILAI